MKPAVKRETFIALRARREGHRIAEEINHPQLQIPEVEQPPRPVEDLNHDPALLEYMTYEPRLIGTSRNADVAACVFGILIALGFMAVLYGIYRW